jgi:hypothetical protein
MEPLVEWDSNKTQSFVEGGKIITIQTGANLFKLLSWVYNTDRDLRPYI